MDNLTHDPRSRKIIKDALYTFLYGPILTVYKTRIDNIILKNTKLGGFTHRSFVYKGELFTCDQYAPPRKGNPLVHEMKPEMEAYLKETKEINETELPYVLGFIDSVLLSSQSLEDYLKVFPSAVHEPIRQLINSCPCRECSLTDASITTLSDKYKETIQMMETRVALNLIT